MHKKKTIIVASLAVLLIVSLWLAAGCSSKAKTTNAGSAKSGEPYQLKGATITSLTDILVAQEKGYLAEEGIVYKDVGTIKSSDTVAALLTGSIDFALFHPDKLALARLGGSKITAIGPGMIDGPQKPHMIYFVKEGSPIKTAQDCIGKKVGVAFTGSCADGIFLDWLNQNGISADKVEFVIVPDAQAEQALKQGLVDIAQVHPSFYQAVINHGGCRILVNTWDVNKDPNAGTSFSITVSEKWAQEHPEVAKGLVRAINKAHDWMNANQDEAIQMAAKYLDIPPQDVTFFHYDDQHLITDERVIPWFQRMIRLGQIKEGQIKPSEIYTNEYNPEYKK